MEDLALRAFAIVAGRLFPATALFVIRCARTAHSQRLVVKNNRLSHSTNKFLRVVLRNSTVVYAETPPSSRSAVFGKNGVEIDALTVAVAIFVTNA